MPGVLVDDNRTFPFDSPTFSPSFENGGGVSQGGELQRVCGSSSPRKPCFWDLNGGDDLLACSSVAQQRPLNLSAFHGLDIFSSTPAENGTPRSRSVDPKEEYAQRVFARALSKLGSNNDLAFGDALGAADGPFCESAVGRARASMGCLSGSDLLGLASGGMAVPLASAYEHSPIFPDAITALQRFLPSNNEDADAWPAVDVYACDEFRMYEFKVRRCMRGRSHDWTECPFAHPGEKARRRDPRRLHYSGTACPDFRKGSCRRGDACEFAHGVFECWLHPARYRTQPCKDGTNCRRRICFFAHTPEQLRLLPGSLQAGSSSSSRASIHSAALKAAAAAAAAVSLGGSYDGSPLRQALAGSLDSALALEGFTGLGQNGILDGACDGLVGGSSPRCVHLGFASKAGLGGCSSSQISSPTSTLAGHAFSPPPLSPPLSPSGSPPLSPNSPSGWTSAFARSLSCLSVAQGSHQCLSALSQAACVQNPGAVSASAMVTHGPSPLSSTAVSPAHRRHLDRLHTVPSVSIPPCLEGRDFCPLNSPGSASSDKVASSQAMNDLMITLQHLELPACPTEPTLWSSNGPSFRFSQSVPVTPTKVGWGGQIDTLDSDDGPEPLQRVESGRDLRAKIYGRLCKENLLENDSPDLGWVNELVK